MEIYLATRKVVYCCRKCTQEEKVEWKGRDTRVGDVSGKFKECGGDAG